MRSANDMTLRKCCISINFKRLKYRGYITAIVCIDSILYKQILYYLLICCYDIFAFNQSMSMKSKKEMSIFGFDNKSYEMQDSNSVFYKQKHECNFVMSYSNTDDFEMYEDDEEVINKLNE